MLRLSYKALATIPRRTAPSQPLNTHLLPLTRMKQVLRTTAFSLLLAAAISSTALGQKTYAFGFGGGVTIPVGKLSDVQKTGYNALAVLAIGVADLPIGVRFDGIYHNLPRADQSAASTSMNGKLRVSGVLANLVYAFPGTSAKPYIIVGGGLYSAKVDTTGAKVQNNFGVNAGLGLTFGIGPFATFLESRYNSISRNAKKGGVFQFVPITFGFLF